MGLSIGFPRTKNQGGPKIFLSRLRRSIEAQSLAATTSFLNPLHQIDIFASYARPVYRKPYVLRLDGIYYDLLETVGRNDDLNRGIFKSIESARALIFQSRFSEALIRRFYEGPFPDSIVVPNGIDLKRFSPLGSDKRRSLGIDSSEKVILTSAQWRRWKRLPEMIEIFEQLYSSDDSYHLIILGKPEEDIVSHPNLHVVGSVEAEELPDWYRTGDCFLFLSWLDNCPNTVVEAIASGLPVVCGNQGGTHELVELCSAGRVLDLDPTYDFELIDIYNPPKIDLEIVVEAVDDLMNNIDHYREKIDTKKIDIDWTARKYVEHVRSVLTR